MNTPIQPTNGLQQEVNAFFSNYTIYQVEQELYDMLQHSLENVPDPHHCKDKLHMYRELTHFLYRLTLLR